MRFKKSPPDMGRFAERDIWIPSGMLQIGMFVSGLDRPWIETPFPLQGFMIRSNRDIESLKLYCDNIQIDAYKCWIEIDIGKYVLVNNDTSRRNKLIAKMRMVASRGDASSIQGGYTIGLEEELPAAKRIYAESAALVSKVVEDIKNGKGFDLDHIQCIAWDMVDSILRNSDALIWLSQLRNKSDYAYQHSINVCILMLNLGRQLRLAPNQLVILAIAGLLQDIGVLLLPEEIINKNGRLTEEEMALARSHVQKGVDLVSQQSNIPQGVISIIFQHHERYDGSGYPKALKGHEISLYGAIAGIADCFDAMVSDRPYSPPRSTFHALMLLYELRQQAFGGAIVERFIQSIGIYPIGSLVEMNTGEVAIVVEQRKERRLKPQLLVVLDSEKRKLPLSRVLDMLEDPLSKSGIVYKIKDVLSVGAYGIDPAEYYLV